MTYGAGRLTLSRFLQPEARVRVSAMCLRMRKHSVASTAGPTVAAPGHLQY